MIIIMIIITIIRWQNERAPRMTTNADSLADSFQSSSSSLLSSVQDIDKLMQSGSWQGLAHLISALQMMYMIEENTNTNGKLFMPWPIDAAREDDMFLRNSMLLALSTIRAQVITIITIIIITIISIITITIIIRMILLQKLL